MQKVIKIDNKVIVIFEDGSCCEREDVTPELFSQILSTEEEEDVFQLMNPQYSTLVKEYEEALDFKEKVEDSYILSLKGESIYWDEVSPLSVPISLARAILNAEDENNELLLETYKNFWTLMSLNPDEECRQNLFWFLERWGLKIAKCGFFVAYRNVVPYSYKEGVEIWTDAHSHTTRIKIGEMVTMPREKCDCDSNVSCSRGLHAAGAEWLNRNYFGSQGLVVLINPADVVAVPHIDNYGKLRTCAYLPIDKAEFDANDHVIPFNEKDGFDCSYIAKVIYEGLMGTEEDSTYKIEIPEVPGITKDTITSELLDIAKNCIINKEV